MAKKKRHGSRKRAIPLAPIMPLAYRIYDSATASGSYASKMNDFITETTGYMPSTNQFVPNRAVPFWVGTIAGVVVHKVANRVGLNNYVRKATMGWLSL